MKFCQQSAVLCVFALPLLSCALPLSDLRNSMQIVRRKAPYSVVPVDGGQPGGDPPPETQTVTKPPKTMPPVTETVLSTTVVTESEAPRTIITTITSVSTPTYTQAPAAQEASPSVTTATTTLTSSVSTTDTVIITTTSTPSLTPYDDGLWHTRYYKPAESSSSSSDTSGNVAEQTQSPAVGAEAPTYTGTPSNGTWAFRPREEQESKHSQTRTPHPTKTWSVKAANKTIPPMPTLPTTSETFNPTEVPSIDISEHLVPGFGR